jgi:hypothetical protein
MDDSSGVVNKQIRKLEHRESERKVCMYESNGAAANAASERKNTRRLNNNEEV